jgi:hypothetical protein
MDWQPQANGAGFRSGSSRLGQQPPRTGPTARILVFNPGRDGVGDGELAMTGGGASDGAADRRDRVAAAAKAKVLGKWRCRATKPGRDRCLLGLTSHRDAVTTATQSLNMFAVPVTVSDPATVSVSSGAQNLMLRVHSIGMDTHVTTQVGKRKTAAYVTIAPVIAIALMVYYCIQPITVKVNVSDNVTQPVASQ